MPSRHSSIPFSSPLPLSEIIELQPEEEPWCAGYAPSQGRRCHARTNAYGRNSAMKLLEKGTERLRAGRSLDTLLEDLAPHVLCTRFHQNQASTLTSRWKRKVRVYLDSQIPSVPSTPSTRTARLPSIPSTASTRTTRFTSTPSVPSTRTTRLSSRHSPSETPEREIDERTALLRKLSETLEELRRLDAAEVDEEHSTGSRALRETESSSRTASPGITESTPRRPASQESYYDRVVQRGPTESIVVQMATAVPRVIQAQVGSTSATPVPRQTSASPTGASVSSSTLSRVNRRKVEGNCGICLCDMHTPQQSVSTADAEVTGNDNNENTDDGDDDEEDDDGGDELTWCKARCGVNFHKGCIDQWLARARTCPACRSNWEDLESVEQA
ncbi:hypothetical protein N7541_003171 [Penicillium brevicompactum]|uniref:RING-type domain-containing protein n=1 Tax=Penicillium brevicompactum TaxID=5074 RepID=A0A9W9RLG7_PENBR|nr:hypothetical protein N7541_003171 [Penicillium brevicompactum]